MRPLLLLLAFLCTSSAVAQYTASRVADIYPGPEDGIQRNSNDRDYFSGTVYAGKLYFRANDGQTGPELWSYDAATSEANLVGDLNPSSEGSFPSGLVVYDGRLYFAAYRPDVGEALWSYHSATNTVTLAADINPSVNGGPKIQSPVVYDDRLFFNGVTAVGSRLWAYDSETGEAMMVGDLSPDVGWFYPFHLTVYDDLLFFGAEDFGNEIGRELWVYDAATDAISLAADIAPGIESSLGDDLFEAMIVYDDRLFMYTGRYDQALWAYDNATGGASLAADVRAAFFAVYDNRLFFDSSNGLWAYDRQTGEASRVAATSSSGYLTLYDERLFFTSAGDVWVYDATTNVASRATSSGANDFYGPSGYVVYDDRLFFNAVDDEHGRELWMLSPTPVASEAEPDLQRSTLYTAHPNPARADVHITLDLIASEQTRVEIFDALGRRVALLADEVKAAGEHTLPWQAAGLPSGVYVVRLTAGDAVQTQRLTLVR